MTAPPRPRAMAPECFLCSENSKTPAISACHWKLATITHTRDGGDALCERCMARWRAIDTKENDRVDTYNRYEPILLAYVGDELWLALECWLETMHRLLYEPSDHRPKRREVKKHEHVWFDVGGGVSRCTCGEEDVTFAVRSSTGWTSHKLKLVERVNEDLAAGRIFPPLWSAERKDP